MTAEDYLYDAEANRMRELARGVLRETPVPLFSHQSLVLRVASLWNDHVEPRKLGRVAVAPIDVILDHERALIVQPDVLFVSAERLSIMKDQVWGAPDLVAEVLSHGGNEYRDHEEKLGWYRQYGVRECWLVDLNLQQVTVVDFTGPFPSSSFARGVEAIRSSVLPGIEASALSLFA